MRLSERGRPLYRYIRTSNPDSELFPAFDYLTYSTTPRPRSSNSLNWNVHCAKPQSLLLHSPQWLSTTIDILRTPTLKCATGLVSIDSISELKRMRGFGVTNWRKAFSELLDRCKRGLFPIVSSSQHDFCITWNILRQS